MFTIFFDHRGSFSPPPILPLRCYHLRNSARRDGCFGTMVLEGLDTSTVANGKLWHLCVKFINGHVSVYIQYIYIHVFIVILYIYSTIYNYAYIYIYTVYSFHLFPMPGWIATGFLRLRNCFFLFNGPNLWSKTC